MTLYATEPRIASCAEAASGSRDCLPVSFDASAHPIIARHWFGVGPLRPIGEVTVEVMADLRFRRKVRRLHSLGPRAVGELLAEVGAERGVQTIIEQKLAQYADLDPATLEAMGGEDFWPVPVQEVRR